MSDDSGWAGVNWYLRFPDLAEVRARLDAGADPAGGEGWWEPPLHAAAARGGVDVVAELAGRIDDVDALMRGRSALWTAVAAGRFDAARALVEAGADPWLDMMSGWSPARLSLSTSEPELFGGGRSLAPEEAAMVAEARRLGDLFGPIHLDGFSTACVAGIDVAEAVRRLDARVLTDDPEQLMASAGEDPEDADAQQTMWATEVPGGVVLTQPWLYGAQMPGVIKALSAGTTCYALYANPKSGNQGSLARDGELLGWDLHPGGGPDEDEDDERDVFLNYLYDGQAVPYCYAVTGLKPQDKRSFDGPPDAWIRIATRDWWK
ncbi:ankyrin repeat domain-containing protein [Kribbella antibiotica]|uniref:ankyrin repeat domain-containing protein n=1 Tax=Kribbella antibiotica TaxID=190195 RepID=UPI00192E2375|nr:ankyrin repeat domain-containing protein [Kribbella antibiotica]